ncbi:MAG: hypothetical protein ACLGHQ_07960, partial [Acidimicrobiia bacterium]
MTEDLEQRIRRAVHDVGLAEVAQPDHVLRRAGQRARARERNRKFALGGTTFVAVAVAVVGIAVVSGRDTRQEGTSAETGVVSTVTAATPISPAVSPTTPPAADSRWRPIAAHPDGIGWDVAATWIGDRAFVLGNQAYTYDPSDDSWSALAPLPETWTPLDGCSATPASCVGEPIGENPNGFGLIEPIVVWTGEKVLVLGGDLPAQEASDEVPDCEGRGACYPNLVLGANFGYVPAADTWQLLAAPPWFVNARSPHVWTGSELLVWPWDVDGNADPAYAYDPAANTWRQLPTVPVAPRQNAASVWTG